MWQQYIITSVYNCVFVIFQAVRIALQKLKNGCSIEDAKAVCEPAILQQIINWKVFFHFVSQNSNSSHVITACETNLSHCSLRYVENKSWRVPCAIFSVKGERYPHL